MAGEVLEIVVDLDNDQIRLIGYQGSTEHRPVSLALGPRPSPSRVRDVLIDIVNAMSDVDVVQLRQQSDGELSTLDEWSLR